MAIEFTKLSEVEQVEAVSDDATVLIEEDGDIKRVAKSEVGVSSWNDLTDKPFYETTEMVEILPEQSVTAQRTNAVGYIFESEEKLFDITVGKEYTVVVNGKSHKAECLDDDGAFIEFGRGTNEYFLCANFDGISIFEWAESYGETITLAIYEEQEVVKKLDPKFVGKTVLYAVGTNEDPYLYHDEALSEKVTKSELFSMNGNVLVYVDLDGNGLNYRYYSPSAYAYNREYGVVYIDNNNTELVTSEYVNAGPM